MKPATWRVGLYSKVVLTVIAVSLAGLLVRQLPRGAEAKPEIRRDSRVKVIELNVPNLRSKLGTHLEVEKDQVEKGNIAPLLTSEERALAQRLYEYPSASFEHLLGGVLWYEYAVGYRVKFATDDFIILESE